MTVKCGSKIVPGLSVEQLLYFPHKPEIMSAEMSPSSVEKKWSTETNKKFDKMSENVEPKKSPNSSRLSFSVDSLLSSIRRTKEPETGTRNEAEEEPDKPEMDDDEELDVDGEEDSDDYVDDEDDAESTSNRFSDQVIRKHDGYQPFKIWGILFPFKIYY